MYAPSNIKTWASCRETSDEIALAIFEISEEDDENRMWESPTEDEVAAVMARAWKLADAETDVLSWGCEIHHRVTSD